METKTYEERIEVEKKERGRKIAELSKRFEIILKQLGCSTIEKFDNEYNWAILMEGSFEGGGSIILRSSPHLDFKKIQVSGGYPYSKATGPHYDVWDDQNQKVCSPSIGVSVTKTDEKIVADIRRRFLPQFETRLKLCVAKVRVSDEWQKTREKNLSKIADILGERLGDDNLKYGEFRHSERVEDDYMWLEVKVGSNVRLDFNGIAPSDAIKLVEAYRSIKNSRGVK